MASVVSFRLMATVAPQLSSRVAPAGVSLAAQLSNYSADDWEEFISEWALGFEPKYVHSERLAGPGDKGRDVVGYLCMPYQESEWDNYQCKHYSSPLQPSNIWVELGKMCFYSWRGDFLPPRKYRFVAPNEVSPTLKELLKVPKELREGLKKNWDKYCKRGITETEDLALEGGLLEHVENYDFSSFGYVPVQDILVQHSRTPFWCARFKLALPDRPTIVDPPQSPESNEVKYVKQLLMAYADKERTPIETLEALKQFPSHHSHFQRSRRWFYRAEQLNRFTRDLLPPGSFEKFKQQVMDGVIDTAERDYPNAFERLTATTDTAGHLQVAQDEIGKIAEVADKKGTCHVLANEDKLHWKAI